MRALHPISPPLSKTDEGVFRVGLTRVTLDSIVASFDAGATPEEIVQQFPSVSLPEVYAVIAYVLGSRSEVDAYLADRAVAAGRVRAENEAKAPPDRIRARLLARRER